MQRKLRFPTEIVVGVAVVLVVGYTVGFFIYSQKAKAILKQIATMYNKSRVLGVQDQSDGTDADVGFRMLDFWVDTPLCDVENPGVVIFKFQSYTERVRSFTIRFRTPTWVVFKPIFDGRLSRSAGEAVWQVTLEPFGVREVGIEVEGPLQPIEEDEFVVVVEVDDVPIGKYTLPVKHLYTCYTYGSSGTGETAQDKTAPDVYRSATSNSFSVVLEDVSTQNCGCYNKTGGFSCKYYKEVDAGIRCETWCKAQGFEYGDKATCEDLEAIYSRQ